MSNPTKQRTNILEELTQIFYNSNKDTSVRCVLCKSNINELDITCPVCRAIKILKNLDIGVNKNEY